MHMSLFFTHKKVGIHQLNHMKEEKKTVDSLQSAEWMKKTTACAPSNQLASFGLLVALQRWGGCKTE